jgi:ADP-heptose:LPS heptosyltransferase
MANQNVLIFSNGELIGDGMMKLPFVRSLPKAFPAANITWLAGRHSTIFKTALNPLVAPFIHTIIDQTHLGDSFQDCVSSRWKKMGLKSHYDVIIDTEKKILPSLFLKRIPHDLFISSSHRWLFSNKKPQKDYQKPPLLLDRLMDLLSVATGRKIEPDFCQTIPQEWLKFANDLLAPYAHKPTVTLAPGAGGRFKCWPLENFIKLARQLEESNIQPLFLLGPAELEWQQTIQSAMPNAVFPLQQAAERLGHMPPVYVTIAIAMLSQTNVANDGGVGHIVASSNQFTISMWGPTDPLKSTPNGEKVRVVRAQTFGGNSMNCIPVHVIRQEIHSCLRASGLFS